MPFRAQHPLVEGELVPRLDADDEVVLDLELHAALLAAEAAVRLDVFVGLDAGVQPAVSRVGEVRPELADGLAIEWRGRLSRSSRAVHVVSVLLWTVGLREKVVGVFDTERPLAQRRVGVDGHRQRTTVGQRRPSAPAPPQRALRHGQ